MSRGTSAGFDRHITIFSPEGRLYQVGAYREYDVLHPVKVVPRVWYLVGIDFVDAPKTSVSGYKCLLTQTDYFTKYVEGIPLPDKTALSVAKGMYSTYCRHGAPAHVDHIKSGKGICEPGDEAPILQVWCQPLDDCRLPSPVKCLDERTNQSGRITFRKVIEDKEDNWDENIEGTLFTVNTNESTTTKYSHFYLMFERTPRLPFEVENTERPLAGVDDIEELMEGRNNEE